MTDVPADWRRGLFRLANALIGYGLVGILVAAVGIAALIGASGRIGSLGERIASEAVSLDAIVVLTAGVLDDAATTVGTFGPTVERTSATVSSAAGALRDIEPRLRDVETQANAFEIFGQRPVAPLGQLFGQIATDVSGLDDRLDAIATEIGRNKAALAANADSLRALADVVRAYKERVKPEAIDAGLDDARRLLLVTLALFIGWTAVPAVGSLIVGRWIRRLVKPEPEPPSEPPGPTPTINSAGS
jgi:predicted transcriptional regulator